MRRYLIVALVLALALVLLGAVLIPSYTLRGGVVDDAPLEGGGYKLRGGVVP